MLLFPTIPILRPQSDRYQPAPPTTTTNQLSLIFFMLQSTAQSITHLAPAINPHTTAANAIHFFIHESIKIISILAIMIFLIAVLRTYIPQSRIQSLLQRHSALGYILAAFFGAITPFCSCSSIPIFIGLIQTGIPIGIAFTFLITSPIINEYLAVLMIASFGIPITLIYIIAGLIIGILGGIILQRWKAENEMDPDSGLRPASLTQPTFTTLSNRIQHGWHEMNAILKRLWLWILLGIAIGALIHNYVPQDRLESWIDAAQPFDVPLAVILGIPLYGSCAAIVPIATALFQKGVPLGTALTFMIAVSALSFPEAIMLRRIITLSLIAKFFFIVTTAIILVGYGINFAARWL